ncbi:MAG TPA: hypothetical protein VH682_25615 [Gemmataceae bacterium]|jgi:hypothetical protein
MIDARFSAAAFDACGLNTPAAQELCQLLEEEIQKDLHILVLNRMQAIVALLNNVDHSLKQYGDVTPGDIAYRDDCESQSGYSCRLRVGIDLIVSCGYAHLTDDETE